MKRLFYLNFIFILIGCSVDTDKTIDTTLSLQDNFFALKDIKSTKDVPDDLCKFTELDSAQKLQLVVPIMQKEMKLDADYVIHYMTARFISRQSLISSPIIVSVNGDDYTALFYIVLDEKNKPISHLLVSGGLCAGPDEINDSLLRICSRRHSVFRNSEIKTFVVTETIQPDSIPKPSIFDSITYQSIIKSNGQIQTGLVDSVRFTRLTKTE